MQFGISIPTCREGMDVAPGAIGPNDIARLARAADDLGFDAAWGNDHLSPSNRIRSLYGVIPNFYEMLTTLTYCAAVTKDLRVATGVAVMPFREPILFAKQVSTLDVLSGGRAMIGVGMGNNREEFQMLFPRKAGGSRGAMLDEELEILYRLLNEEKTSYKGVYHEFNDVVLEPKPRQKPFPIYISGRSGKTMERTVKFGTGLIVFSPTREALVEQIDKLGAAARERGRDLSEFDIVVNTTLSLAKTKEEAVDRFYQSFTGRRAGVNADPEVTLSRNIIGTPEDAIERIGALREAGLKHCAITGVAADSIEERIEQWQMFASEVMPRFKGEGAGK